MTLKIIMPAMYVILGIVPFSILRYYPFRQKMRLKPRLFWCLYSALVLLETAWFVQIKRDGSALGVKDGELLRLAFYGVHLALSCFVIRERLEKHLFVWCINFIFSSTLTAFTNFTDSLISYETPYLVSTVTMLVFLPPFLAFGFRFMKGTITALLENTGLRTHRLMTSLLFVIFVMGLITTRELPFQNTSPAALLVIRLAASVGGVLACLIFKSMEDEQQKVLSLQRERQRQETLLAISEKQFSNLSEKIGGAKRARHDLKHHFAAIQSYLLKKDYDGLSAYISDKEKIQPAYSVLTFCENTTINMILSYYYDKAKACGVPIDIRAAAPAAHSVSYTETWVLLGNLLENALEGSLRVTDGPRQIRVNIECKEHSIGIAIDNLCNEAFLIKTADGFRSMKDTENCGNGLASVTLLAKKHNGMASFEVREGWFLASVSLIM